MRPGARIGAAIEILEELEKGGAPADRVLTGYTRNRRYIGSKDRREIGNLVFSVLRSRLRLTWWLERSGQADKSPRSEVLAALCLVKALTKDEIAQLFAGEGYGPAVLTPEENSLVTALSGAQLDDPEQPAWVRDEVEPWLHERLQARFGEDTTAEMAALRQEADVILRVNALKATRPEAQEVLAQDDVVTEATGISPLGLRIEGRRNLQASRAFREGLVEVQDEGSQLIALLCEAQPGMAVADYCAGAGGKTLALAAEMRGQGRLVALDTDAKRLQRAEPRLARAGAGFVAQRTLPDDGWLAGKRRGLRSGPGRCALFGQRCLAPSAGCQTDADAGASCRVSEGAKRGSAKGIGSGEVGRTSDLRNLFASSGRRRATGRAFSGGKPRLQASAPYRGLEGGPSGR